MKPFRLDTYKLPMHVAAALATARPELLALGPVNLDTEAQKEVLRLLSDLIQERQHFNDKLHLFQQVYAEQERTLIGLARKSQRTVEAMLKEPTRDAMQEAIRRKEPEEL